MTIDELRLVLEKHRAWLSGEDGGASANLQDAYLQGADLRAADLRAANLQDAYLRAANLQDADLQAADLRAANLQDADLQGADLRAANLQDADLRAANLQDAYLQDAYLQDADLRGADLQYADLRAANLRAANLQDAYLRGADLRAANLQDADLQDANLQDAYLQGADLRDADLRGAYLRGADLRGADLRGALGVNKCLTTPLYGMTDAVGPIRAYKLVTEKYQGPRFPSITYRAGETLSAPLDTDENTQCGAGINLATLDWVMREWKEGYHILIAEFEIKDAAKDICIPVGSDGKFRVRECRIVGEKDLVQLGLVDPPRKSRSKEVQG